VSRRAILKAGLRRLALLLAALTVGTGVVSLLAGAIAGVHLGRAVSVGYYVVGSFALVAGFFVGNRGPARGRGHSGNPFFGRRELRWARPEEQEEALSTSAVLVAVGVVLVVIGLAVDPRVRVF
jgi:hypothetical protein